MKQLTNELLFDHLRGEDFIHPLELASDIDEVQLNERLSLKRVTDNDWIAWFGMRIHHHDDGISRSYTHVGGGTLINSPLVSNAGPGWITVFDNNYVIAGKGYDERDWIRDFDRALRLYSTGRSGIAFGLSRSMHQPVHPAPGWRKLNPTKILTGDIPKLLRLTDLLKGSLPDRTALLVDRFRHATQGGNEIGLHNRLLDLITILEVLFVPDGRSGEIGYKLRARGTRLLSKVMAVEPKEMWNTLKNLYDLRSKAVHGGDLAEISGKSWWTLTDIARVGILSYIEDPKKFEPSALDMALF